MVITSTYQFFSLFHYLESCSNSLNILPIFMDYLGFKDKTTNTSSHTISIHIMAYENKIITTISSIIHHNTKKIKP